MTRRTTNTCESDDYKNNLKTTRSRSAHPKGQNVINYRFYKGKIEPWKSRESHSGSNWGSWERLEWGAKATSKGVWAAEVKEQQGERS